MIYEGVAGYGKIEIKENGMTLINMKYRKKSLFLCRVGRQFRPNISLKKYQ